jgi:hypothetical protein
MHEVPGATAAAWIILSQLHGTVRPRPCGRYTIAAMDRHTGQHAARRHPRGHAAPYLFAEMPGISDRSSAH